jgi:excisionase family DNA binding protein
MREGPFEQLLEMLRDEIVIAVETVLGAALDQALDDALERHALHCCEGPVAAEPDAERGSHGRCVNRTRKEAAGQLRVTESTIDRWRACGRLAWHREVDAGNGRVLIKQTDIDEYLLRGRRDGP